MLPCKQTGNYKQKLPSLADMHQQKAKVVKHLIQHTISYQEEPQIAKLDVCQHKAMRRRPGDGTLQPNRQKLQTKMPRLTDVNTRQKLSSDYLVLG
jgi:hypothetical protein